MPGVAALIYNSRTTDPIPGSLIYVVNLSAQYEMEWIKCALQTCEMLASQKEE